MTPKAGLIGHLLPGAHCRHPALLQHHDVLGRPDGGEPVGDDHHGQIPWQAPQRLLNSPFILQVQVAGGLVQQQQRGPAPEGPVLGVSAILTPGLMLNHRILITAQPGLEPKRKTR